MSKIKGIKGFDANLQCRGFKFIPGYEGLYSVNKHGIVVSAPRKTTAGILGGKVLTPQREKNGYYRVTLSKDGEARRYSVHRLVLLTFCGEPTPGQEARHLDGNRGNNALDNLRWGSRHENAMDRSVHGTHPDRRGEKHPMSKISDRDAAEIHALATSGQPYSVIAQRFPVSAATVSRLKNQKGWGHIFKQARA